MLRFGNPYTRDSSSSARNNQLAAQAISLGGRSGGIANENQNRDLTHRVVTALQQCSSCSTQTRMQGTKDPPLIIRQ